MYGSPESSKLKGVNIGTPKSSRALLRAFVNLLQQYVKDSLAEYRVSIRASHLWRCVDERREACIRLRLVLPIRCVHPDLPEDFLDTPFCLWVLPPVVCVEDRALGGISKRKGRVDAPRALVVHNIRADLADLLRCPSVVEVIILDLEVLAERDKNGQRDLVVVWI